MCIIRKIGKIYQFRSCKGIDRIRMKHSNLNIRYFLHSTLKIDNAPFSPPATRCLPIGYRAQRALPD